MTCDFCGEPVDERTCWHRVVGWERKAQGGSRRSGSDVALRRREEVFACNACVMLRKGGHVGQEALL